MVPDPLNTPRDGAVLAPVVTGRPGSRSRGRLTWAVRWCAWLYLAAALVFWCLLYATADTWWLGTLLMYGPRWMLMLPLGVLVPGALLLRRWSLGPLLAAAGVTIVPVMGLSVPMPATASGGNAALHVRILTCNVNGDNLDSDRLASLIAEKRPDVVALEEWTSRNQALAAWQKEGWHVQADGELCLASRFQVRQVDVFGYHALEGKGSACLYELETPAGVVSFFCVHLASPRPGLEAVLEHHRTAPEKLDANRVRRRHESEIVSERASQVNGPLLLAGDFNLPCDSRIYRDYWSVYTDSHEAAGWGFGYTWYTRRFGALRIDHVLAGPGWRCLHSEVGPDVLSDHRPVIADFEWTDAKE